MKERRDYTTGGEQVTKRKEGRMIIKKGKGEGRVGKGGMDKVTKERKERRKKRTRYCW